MKKLILSTVASLGLLAATSQAATILEWTTINGTGNTSVNPTSTIGVSGALGATGVINANLDSSSGVLSRGAGLPSGGYQWNTSNQFTGAPSWPGFQQNTLAFAQENNNYAQLTLTPTAGYKFSLNTIGYTASSTGQSAAVATVELLYSTDGFATAGTSLGSVLSSATNSYGTLNVSGVSALQNSTSATTFRFYVYSSYQWDIAGLGLAANAGTLPVITFDGSVAAIPEPATWALLAGSLTTLMVIRRRRKG